MIYKSINKRAIDDSNTIASLKYEVLQLKSKLDYLCMMTGIDINVEENDETKQDTTDK